MEDKIKRNDYPEAQFSIAGGLTQEEIADIIQKRNAYLKSLGYDVSDAPVINTTPQVKKPVYFKAGFGAIFKIDDNKHAAYRLNNETGEWQEDDLAYGDIIRGNMVGERIQMEENYPYGEPFQYGRHL